MFYYSTTGTWSNSNINEGFVQKPKKVKKLLKTASLKEPCHEIHQNSNKLGTVTKQINNCIELKKAWITKNEYKTEARREN